ncbi:hypothetical protein GCM10011504_55710 [Siccirubricoccus deserti]|uniref:Uncharacterized protein n=1 Tax=Siccirubricoccus deserti TaxID=2013562 RepID=A0A9X0UGJ1_9PROT|nr:hypothetical protein [Siccirubricoccus deserti]MBC4019061.1 hypothetical protein [Siccirubricoccus deserti]GGC70787.1 hypothetical protein GCM10011504_55710 [Siccirubricoccus deserti]
MSLGRWGWCWPSLKFGHDHTAALSLPAELGLALASWTRDRLVTHLADQGFGMRRSWVSEVLLAEGLNWRQEETWFGARVDPGFTPGRG